MALVVEYHEELETDLLAQGVDLLDFWRGRITPRRMRVLIGNLPTTGRTIAKVQPEAAYQAAWSPTDYLLADMFDAYAQVNFQDPKPYPRPMDAWQQRQRDEQAAAFLAAQAERNRARDRAATNP